MLSTHRLSLEMPLFQKPEVSLKEIAAGKKYFYTVLRFYMEEDLQLFFVNSQFIKKLQTVEVCSII